MMKWVLALAVIAGLMAFGFAWDRDRAYHDPMNALNRSTAQYNAAKTGESVSEPSQPWYEKNPLLFGGAVGVGVFLIGTLVVIAQNTSPNSRAVGATGENEKPPATS